MQLWRPSFRKQHSPDCPKKKKKIHIHGSIYLYNQRQTHPQLPLSNPPQIRVQSGLILCWYLHRNAYTAGRGFLVFMKNTDKSQEFFLPSVFLGKNKQTNFVHRRHSKRRCHLNRIVLFILLESRAINAQVPSTPLKEHATQHLQAGRTFASHCCFSKHRALDTFVFFLLLVYLETSSFSEEFEKVQFPYHAV